MGKGTVGAPKEALYWSTDAKIRMRFPFSETWYSSDLRKRYILDCVCGNKYSAVWMEIVKTGNVEYHPNG